LTAESTVEAIGSGRDATTAVTTDPAGSAGAADAGVTEGAAQTR
jgi:hypothetical protein